MRKQAYRRFLALLIAAAMCTGLWPAAAQAGTYSFDTAKPMTQESGQALAVQVIEESLQDIVQSDYPLTEDYYAAEVIDALNELYDETLRYTQEHPEEVQIIGMWIMIPESIATRMKSMEMIKALTKDLYRGAGDTPALKKQMQEGYNAIVRSVNPGDYNDWYRDKYESQKASAKAKIAAIKDLDTYIGACGEELFVSFSTVLDQDDTDWIIRLDEEETGGFMSFLFDNDIGSDSIVTKELLGEAIEVGQEEFDGLLKNAVKEKLFTPSAGLKKKLSGFAADAKKLEDLNEIIELYDQKYEAYNEELTKAEDARLAKDTSQRLSSSDQRRWDKKMEKKLYSYDHNVYSTEAFSRLQEIYSDYYSRIWDCNTQNEAKQLWNKYTAELNKVPVLSVELKNTRAKYLKEWKKKYSNKKKYDQKKVKKALKRAKADLNKAKTMGALETAAAASVKKLEASIYVYPVKIEKKGKGTVSPSKKVACGKSYVLKISPAPGKALKSVTINGKKQKKLKYTYKLKIRKKTTIQVTFR